MGTRVQGLLFVGRRSHTGVRARGERVAGDLAGAVAHRRRKRRGGRSADAPGPAVSERKRRGGTPGLRNGETGQARPTRGKERKWGVLGLGRERREGKGAQGRKESGPG
jgi:hypothetical protein